MREIWLELFFEKGYKPRGWFRSLVLRSDGTARPVFRRLVHKKNGVVRPQFEPFVTSYHTGGNNPASSALASTPTPAEVVLRGLTTMAEMASHWKKSAPLPDLMSVEALTAKLAATGGPLILAAGHDNYRQISGGIQFCTQREETIARGRGMTYLQFHPWQPLPMLADAALGAEYPVTMICNGETIGTTLLSTLTEATRAAAASGRAVRLVIHHLLGHTTEGIAALGQVAGPVVFWLHDHFTLCPSFTLQRNQLGYCGAPDAKSNACGLCFYGPERGPHKARMGALFASVPMTVLAPSQVTADFWIAKADLPSRSVQVIPHATLEPVAKAPVDPATGPLRIGFLGAQVVHKGWPVFAGLAHELVDTDCIFTVFSTDRPSGGGFEWRKVHVTAEQPDAMSRAVAEAQIDFVVHWASWTETFSYTAFEALAGGAQVLTNPISGNVRAVVEKTGAGAVFADRAALVAFFRDGAALKQAQEQRAARAAQDITLRHSDLTFSVANWI